MKIFSGSCIFLTILVSVAAIPLHAETLPRPAWAHAVGLVDLQPNGITLADDNALSRFQIQEAFARWGIAFDERRLDVVRSLFTPDALYKVTRGSNEPIARAQGIDNVVEAVSRVMQRQSDQRRHVISNIVVDRLTPTEATAIAYGIVTIAADGLSLGATVIYSGQLQRGDDGIWRFSRFIIGMDEYYESGKTVNPDQ